jgi:hypothetical protein
VLGQGVENPEERGKSIDALHEKRNYPPERVAVAIVKAIRRNRAVVPVAPEPGRRITSSAGRRGWCAEWFQG